MLTDTSHVAADAESLQVLLCPHVNRLTDYLERHIPAHLRRLIEPQDVVQDTLFEAFRSIARATFADQESVWRWLVTIARNRLINLIEANQAARRGGGLKHLYEDEVRHGSVVAMLQELAVFHKTPSKSAARREFLVILDRAIERLKPACREAIRLRFVEGMSLRAISTRLGRSDDAIQRLCVSGLHALRAELRTMSLYF